MYCPGLWLQVTKPPFKPHNFHDKKELPIELSKQMVKSSDWQLKSDAHWIIEVSPGQKSKKSTALIHSLKGSLSFSSHSY